MFTAPVPPPPRCLERGPYGHARVWYEERLVREEAHAAEGGVAPLSSVALHVATHDAGAGDDPMDLQEQTTFGASGVRDGGTLLCLARLSG